jgi:large subunit ribosomal protein L15
MILDDVHRGIEKRKERKRIGRGPGSGQGKTAGKGHKGYFSRTGSSTRTGFVGGQTPLHRRIAKSGFNNNYFARKVAIVNLAVLEERFENGDSVTPEVLLERGLVKGKFDEIKILGNGKLTKKLSVQVHAFSKSAEESIQKAGGKIERLIGS